MQVDSMRIEMLGGFSVWVNGEQVIQDSPKMTKPWQLFCYLVLHREKFVPNRKLISVLWADDMLTDPANVLKNAVYSLRKELCGGESLPSGSPILYASGGYRIDPAVQLELDVDEFTALCRAALNTDDPDDKMAKCREAVNAYSGDFLPQLDAELWVVPLVLDYKNKYLGCAHELSEQLWRRKQFRELLEITTAAQRVELLDEKNTVYLFRALDALRMYRVIVTTYSKVTQAYEDSMGGNPPTEVQRIYHAASERINKTEQDIIIIKTEMTGAEQANRPQRGAYFCSYSNLKHMYPLLRRAAERNDQKLVLALFTLTPQRGATATAYDMTRAMAEFKVVAMNALRKTDAIARYSRNQYAMLLSVSSLDDGRLVRDRIKENFAPTATERHLGIDVKLTEV